MRSRLNSLPKWFGSALVGVGSTGGDNRGVSNPVDIEMESGASDRLIFFSDAVVAIAITLLALELPVPEGKTAASLWRSIRQNDGHYLAFLVSFVVIAMAWSEHHQAFRYLERTDSRLRALTFFWLLTIVINPFATKLLTIDGGDSLTAHAIRFGFYSLVQVLSAVAMLASTQHMLKSGLASAEASSGALAHVLRRHLGVILGFGLSIPVFFLTKYGWVLWAVVPIVMGILRRRYPIDNANQKAPAD
jgi:uncharacterized membrane protein